MLNTSAPNKKPTQSAEKLRFPAWRLANGVMNATDENLEISATSCERWTWGCGGMLLFGLLVEVVVAVIHPPYDSFAGTWASVIADSFVTIGVGGEIIFAFMGFRRQDELGKRAKVEVGILNKLAGEANERAAEALQKVAEADLARVTLETKVAPRRLSLEATLTLFDELRDKIPPIYLRALGDAEVRQYAQDFFNAFLMIGLIIVDEPTETVIVTPPGKAEKLGNFGFAVSEQTNWVVGLQVYVPPEMVMWPGMSHDPLVLALKKAGVQVGSVWSSEWPKHPTTIPDWKPGNRILIVGEKPPDR